MEGVVRSLILVGADRRYLRHHSREQRIANDEERVVNQLALRWAGSL